MAVDGKITSKVKKTKGKKKKSAPVTQPGPSGSHAQPTKDAFISTSTPQEKWTEVVGRKAAKASRAGGPSNSPAEFPSLTTPKPAPRRIPPLRNAALIVKVREGSSFEDTVRPLQQSGINPIDLGATVTGMRKTRSGDVLVDLAETKSPELPPHRS